MIYRCPICHQIWGNSDAYVSRFEEGGSIDTAITQCCDFCEDQRNVDVKFRENLLNVLREISQSLDSIKSHVTK
jgi:hypothetical protein